MRRFRVGMAAIGVGVSVGVGPLLSAGGPGNGTESRPLLRPIKSEQKGRTRLGRAGVLRERAVAVDLDVWNGIGTGAGDSAVLPLFGDRELTVRFDRREVRSANGFAVSGGVVGLPGSRVTLVGRGGVVAGAVHAMGLGEFEIRPGANGTYVVRELDAGRLGTCGYGGDAAAVETNGAPEALGGAPGSGVSGKAARSRRAGGFAALGAGSWGCDDGSVIDVLVVYTADAKTGAGGQAAIEALIDLAVADANDAFTNSLINTSVQLVHSAEISYIETGVWMTDGPRLIDPDDGYLDDAYSLRDTYGADCVSLWVETLDAGGIGYFPHGSLTGIGSSGISILRRDNAAILTFAHEIGHNLFCAHDRPNAPDTPFADYSYGYREPGSAWRTIMAYPPGDLIPHFANPNVTWPGPVPPNPGPTGVAVGNPEPSDVALTINETRAFVANFRPTAVPGLPSVLYVRADAAGGGDGLSWGTAFDDLEDALCAAGGSDGAVQEIWVKAGTYYPDRGSGERGSTFRLVDGLTIYGGFAGSETLLSQRDVGANVTTLSGDIGTPADDSDNCYHVVTGSYTDATAVLDGFTITKGNADGTDPADGGGGMIVYGGGNPTVANCTFTDNTGQFGGGLHCRFGSSPSFAACTFTGNVATGGAWPDGGGGVYCYSLCDPTFDGCTFSMNTANLGGGVAALFDCNLALTDCTFDQNSVSGTEADGGGMYQYANCDSTLTGVTFDTNSALRGGGMANYFDCDPTLTGCTFEQNMGPAGNEGAGMYNYSNSNAELTDCVFDQNTSSFGGGMASLFDCVPVVTGCVFRMNASTGDGGGVVNYSNCHAALTNCLFAGNTANFGGASINLFTSEAVMVNCSLVGNEAFGAGGGIYNHESDPTVTNSILWLNEVGAVMDQAAQMTGFNSTPAVDYCTIQGGVAGLGGTGNDGTDPTLADADGADNVMGTADDNARPSPGSAAIDTGDNGSIPAGVSTDLDGGPRITQSTVDRGAYEFLSSVPADCDRDGDVDGVDFSIFASCFNKAGNAPRTLGCSSDQSDKLDFDDDGDVDGVDFSVFASCFNKAGNPPRTLGCALY